MSKGLYQFFSIFAPVIYLVISVLSIDPITGFSYWIMATFITEMLLWTLFILEYEWIPEQKRNKKCRK
jgi:uncharacterized BrkB/YihY/UPF0761 family membrane protein